MICDQMYGKKKLHIGYISCEYLVKKKGKKKSNRGFSSEDGFFFI